WTSIPVGSMPYLTRSGLPVLMLRSSFSRSSPSGAICSTPRRIKTIWTSTLFTSGFSTTSRINHRPTAATNRPGHFTSGFPATSGIDLKAANGLKGMTIMGDCWFTTAGRPTDNHHVKAGRAAEQPVLLQKVESEVGQAGLLGGVHGRGGRGSVFLFGRAHFHKNNALRIN